jgi:arylsulfatase A-like enzyme
MKLLTALCSILLGSLTMAPAGEARPNILWITSEDNGPHLGCYGDDFANTPHLDALAAKGMVYARAWSTSPVCAPARTALISGMYPSSTGAEHMRSHIPLPSKLQMYPQFLREIGYYCTNNSKEDFNLIKPNGLWDESSRKAHWQNRKPGQPFFAIFNHTISHESQLRNPIDSRHQIHDPDKVRIPAYHPDTPAVRRNWAQYYDRITMMDTQAGENLRELEDAGLLEDTIIFYYGDHGSGMPRSKRWPYHSGLHVPLIIFVPEKFKHLAPGDYTPGGRSERLVGFVDLAPTLLSIVGVRPPEWMEGMAFMGKFATPPPPFLFGQRGRMDERIDMVRSVTDGRYIYIRNYMPHRIYGQHLDYMFQTQTTRVWRDLYDHGKLRPPQTFFWETKPAEELYDLANDPDEINNLAQSAAHQETLQRLKTAQQTLAVETRDLGFLSEAEMHSRSAGTTPYEMARHPGQFPVRRIVDTAELAASLHPGALPHLTKAMSDSDSAVRYWAATGLLIRGQAGVKAARKELNLALQDPSPSVQIIAAEALGRYGNENESRNSLKVLLELARLDTHGLYVSIQALNSLDHLDPLPAGLLDDLKALPTSDPSVHSRMTSYVPRMIEHILGRLEAQAQ